MRGFTLQEKKAVLTILNVKNQEFVEWWLEQEEKNDEDFNNLNNRVAYLTPVLLVDNGHQHGCRGAAFSD